MASVCSLAWWWLAFVRLWFWWGWLVVGVFSPLLWGQRLFAGMVVAGVCSPLVLAWLVGGGVCSPVVSRSRSCVSWTCSLRFGGLACVGRYAVLEEFTGVCRRNTVSWRYLFRLSRSSLKCVATLGLAGAGILVLSKWCYVLLLWAVGVLPFASITSESSRSFWRSWPRAGWESYLA